MNASDKSSFRIARKYGSPLWQIKQAPGWRVVCNCPTLADCAVELINLGGAPAVTSVACNTHPWPVLADLVEKGIEL